MDLHGASERFDGRRDRPGGRAVLALAFSLAANAAVISALDRAGAFHLGAGESTRVALAVVAPEQWERNRSAAAATPPDPGVETPPRAQEREREVADRPVVAVAPSADARRPADARFLADRDNTVPRDMQSRDAGKKAWKTVLARPTPGPDGGPQGIPEAGDGGDADELVRGREGSPPVERTSEEVEAAIARARRVLAPPAPDAASLRPGARPPAPGPGAGEGGSRRSGRYDPRLLPTAAAFHELAGGPSAQHLPGVEVGDETVLNTRRFKYAEFYVRLKAAFTREFDPDRAWNARDPQSLRYGRKRRTTTVDVVLDRAGEVLDVRVVRSSGLDFYDAEVMRAFRAAAPFPNPPLGLVAADGRIVIPSYEVAYTHPSLLRGIAGGLAPASAARP